MFSVVIPAYNAETTINRAVNSVLAQTLPADEIIIVADDGKDYRDMIDNKIIRHIRSNGIATGPGYARNVGIDAARHTYIALLDADDAFHSERLETIAPLVNKFGAAFTSVRYLDDEIDRELPNINMVFNTDCLSPIELALSGLHTYGHIAFDRVHCPARYDFSPAAQDAVFAMKLYNYVDSIGYSNKVLFDYYRTAQSFCNQTDSAQKFLDFIDMLLNSDSAAFSVISRYKAFDSLKALLECMREAEVLYLANHEQKSFQEIYGPLARERLLPMIAA